MFSNTAFEAMYQYLGLELHSKFIELITSQKVFLGIMIMTFGFMFFVTSMQFFSRYIPGVLVARRSVPLSKYVKIVCLLFLGISLLKVGGNQSVKRFNGESWHDNPYIHGQLRHPAPQYKVSFVFDLMSRTAEEITAVIARVTDSIFQTTNSQLEAPNFFFKAIMYGAASTIEDKDLKQTIRFYTDECFDRMLPMMGQAKKDGKLDGFFQDGSEFDRKLFELNIQTDDKTPYTCLDVKNDIRERMKAYALSRPGVGKDLQNFMRGNPNLISQPAWTNLQISNALVNEYQSSHEAALGIQKGSQVPTTGGRIIQYLNRIMSFDGIINLVSGGSLSGAWVAAERSQEFSENLARAPHVAGFIKMILIAVFPWLLFFVIAGQWRVLMYWWLMYFSVLLWTPIWALLYHVMASITLSAEVLESFGRLNDGISLYSASLVSSRIYHMFAVYSWLQLLTGTAFSGALLYFIRPAMTDTETDSSPDNASTVVEGAGKVATKVGAFV